MSTGVLIFFPCMIMLQDNITKHRYHSIDELEADVVLLCQNTHTYNVEGSQVTRSSVVGIVYFE